LGTRGEFKQVLNFVQVSRIKPVIDRIFSLKEAGQAHQRLAEGRQLGKVVLRMDR
jgi:zinc-binding alcohol dehydrogenase/oxidoreductase